MKPPVCLKTVAADADRRAALDRISEAFEPIARLVPYEEDPSDFRVLPRVRPLRGLKKIRGVPLKRPVDVLRILEETREER